MKFILEKICLLLYLFFILIFPHNVYSKNNKDLYSQNTISNYFSGIISKNRANNKLAFEYFNSIQHLKNEHDNFNIQFIRTLVILEKYNEAFMFSKKIWSENEILFESDILLGIHSLMKDDYSKALKHFQRINKIFSYDLYIEKILANILISWTEAARGNKTNSFKFADKIPDQYESLKKIQNTLLQCHFDLPETQISFEELVAMKDHNFSRYNFFLVNYLISKNRIEEGTKVLDEAIARHSSNLLLKQTREFISKKKFTQIKNLFDCKDHNDAIAEIFYILGNIYSVEKDYQVSNFYGKISLFFNKKFLPNKTLLAENFFYEEKFKDSKKVYSSLKLIGSIYSWHSSLSIATILSHVETDEVSISNLENEFKKLKNPDFKNFYDIANFYKDRKYYKLSIKYYTLALESIDKDHILITKILYKRGTSYERLGDFENSEKDLLESLKIDPDQAYVLNYLAYGWVEKNKNIDESLQMLEKATRIKKDDGYIIDSLGWAHYMNKNYKDAEKYLQKAVEIMPLDPVVNDHYADVLWMLNKNLQARYFWKHVLNLDETEEELRDKVKKKIIFGISNPI